MSYYEERRLDRAAQREQDRIDARERQAADRATRIERDARRERARLRRVQAVRRVWSGLLAEGDTVAAVVVMGCSIVPALYFQLAALIGAGLWVGIAVALAVMLEAGAWVALFATERARRCGRPTLPFTAAMWGCAGVAAAVNYTHAPGEDGGWLAWVLAAASLGGVFFWELRALARHPAPARGTQAERRTERARRRHLRQRRRRFPTVWSRYRDLLAAHPHHTLDTEGAWAQAWRDVHGADPGTTATVVRARHAARAALDDANAEESASDLHQSAPYPVHQTPTPPTPPKPRQRAAGKGRRPQGKRTFEELLGQAREVTAHWPVEQLAAERLRTELRCSPVNARRLRETLRADRTHAHAGAEAVAA
ncbi:hypothetical protein JJV70_19245 [Streptomyces sp. JJ66]|uniref:hypothetical protein n=1 Tax=Streptomyces sp. JJ66 TaxID=2803843 RepID=UPI001C588BB3|nr:hypothetical protein [Streptomyces sp. JJ66]MBW1604196.1 hypothetical protein [Streptomyces sp. JJ66]